MYDPYRTLAQEILIATAKDYKNGNYLEKAEIRKWVKGDNPAMKFCLEALDIHEKTLRKVILDKLDGLDRGESLYKDGKVL